MEFRTAAFSMPMVTDRTLAIHNCIRRVPCDGLAVAFSRENIVATGLFGSPVLSLQFLLDQTDRVRSRCFYD